MGMLVSYLIRVATLVIGITSKLNYRMLLIDFHFRTSLINLILCIDISIKYFI